MSSLYSSRLDKRNFELNISKNSKDDSLFEKGEITGDQIMYQDIDKGMPLIGNFTPSKNDKKYIQDTGSNLDFDLFDKKSDLKINYYDPFLSNLNDTTNLAHIDNYKENNVNTFYYKY